jgi:hypothetical protein
MSAKVNLTAIAAATAVLVTPMLASAMTTARGKLPPPRSIHTPVVISPEGRVIGTDPSLAVRFELARDYGRGR